MTELDVPCPYCRAVVGQPCVALGGMGAGQRVRSHLSRSAMLDDELRAEHAHSPAASPSVQPETRKEIEGASVAGDFARNPTDAEVEAVEAAAAFLGRENYTGWRETIAHLHRIAGRIRSGLPTKGGGE